MANTTISNSEIFKHPLFFIGENPAIRERIVKMILTVEHSTAIVWALEIAKHIIEESKVDLSEHNDIIVGFYLLCIYAKYDAKKIPLLAQNKSALRSLDIDADNITPAMLRATGLKIHNSVFASPEFIKSAAIRVVAQAISSPFLFEQCLNTADFALVAIANLYPNDAEKLREERTWQWQCLSSVVYRLEELPKQSK